MKQQVIINVGVSGSGKTTWSTEYIKNNPNTLRINRDDIRKAFVADLSDYYQRTDLNLIETIVSHTEAYVIVEMLRKNYNVIVDNTHLKPSYIKERVEMIKYWSDLLKKDVDIKFKLFPLDNVWTLKSRVKERDKRFEADYIDKQLVQLKSIMSYVESNYKNQILE